MILTPHMLVGAAIGSQVSNPWLAFCFGLLSHYLIDLLPHWDYLQEVKVSNPSHIKKVMADLLIGAIAVLVLTWPEPNKLIIFVAVAASILPDFMNGIYLNFKTWGLKHHSIFHNKIHIFKGLSFWQGILTTIIVSFLAIFMIIHKWG